MQAFLAGSALVKPTLFRNAVNKHRIRLIRFNLLLAHFTWKLESRRHKKVTITKLNAGNEVFQKDNENRLARRRGLHHGRPDTG